MGIHPATAATGESDQYGATRTIMRSIGIKVDHASTQKYLGIKASPGPAIVLHPDFVTYPGEYFDKFPLPAQVRISNRSTLIVRGSNITIESLDLDGTLILDYPSGEKITIRNLVVKNLGWKRVVHDIKDISITDPIIKMRGYHIEKIEQELKKESNMCVIL